MGISMHKVVIRTDRLHHRIQAQIKTAGIPKDAFANFKACLRVVKKFHLITPHAMDVLDKDPKLLKKLEKCFKRSRELTPDLIERLTSKGLLVTAFGRTDTFFYGVRSSEEQDAYREIVEDYTNNPTPEDIALLLEMEEIELDISMPALSNFGPSRRYNLHFVLDPRKSDLCSHMRKKGIERVVILPPFHDSSREGIVVKSSNKDKKDILYIPIEELNTSQHLDLRIISAMPKSQR